MTALDASPAASPEACNEARSAALVDARTEDLVETRTEFDAKVRNVARDEPQGAGHAPRAAANAPSVALVGAGPGDPELLTVKALKRLQQADVVLTDDLVDARVLACLPPSARVLRVGKRGGCVSTEQRFIHELMIREARAGARVVRLKGGDPFVFGRGGEEVDALREAGIAVEVINGLSAGLAAPAAVGVPVTDRRCTPGVAFVTGHNGDHGIAPDWAALARSRLTLVVYMGLARAASIAQALQDGGLAATTPAVIVSAAHTPRQRECFTTLADLPAAIAREGLPSPALLVIGEVVALSPHWRADVGLSAAADDGQGADVGVGEPAALVHGKRAVG